MKISTKRSVLFIILVLISSIDSLQLNKDAFSADANNNMCWVGKFYDKFKNLQGTSVADMLIPGTHDSGMILDQRLKVAEGTIVDFIKSPRSEKAETLESDFYHYYTQYHTIKGQMEIGIRLFDVRFKKVGLTDKKIKNQSYNKDDLYIFHGEIPMFTLVLPTNLKQTLTDVVEFLDKCTKDFIILKVKLDDQGATNEFFATLRKVLADHGKKEEQLIYYARKVPTFGELVGKIWIIPDKFNANVLKTNIKPPITSQNPLFVWNTEKDSCFIKPYNRYSKFERCKTAQKREELQEFIRNQGTDKNTNTISCFGFNVSKVATPASLLKNKFNKNKNHPGTSKGEYLFEILFNEKKNQIHRGFISIDWATSKNTNQIIRRSEEICQNLSENLR